MGGFGKILIIGGGKGTVRHIEALKPLCWSYIRVIVPMSDTGGSTGRIRQDLDTSPWGDTRRVLGALAPCGSLMGLLFEYRFPKIDPQDAELVSVECWNKYAEQLASRATHVEARFCRVFKHCFSGHPLAPYHHLLGFRSRIYAGKLLGSIILAALSALEGGPVAGLQAAATLLDILPRQYRDIEQQLAASKAPMEVVMPSEEVVGNLILAALDEIEKDFDEAIRSAARLLDTRGAVYPCSRERLMLRAYLKDGDYLEGQSRVSHDKTRKSRIERVMLLGPSKVPEYDYDTNPDANPYAVREIEESDTIFIGPGALHASILASAALRQIAKALVTSSARKIYWLNTAIRWLETRGFGPEEHVRAILDHVQFTDEQNHVQGIKLDLVVVNSRFPEVPEGVELLRWDQDTICGIPVLAADLIDESDLARGSYYLHDREKIRAILPKVLERSKSR